VTRTTLYAVTALAWLGYAGLSAWSYVQERPRTADPYHLYAQWPIYQMLMILAFRFPFHVAVLTALPWLELMILPRLENLRALNTQL
jgi:hypothetical protein